MDFLNQTFDNYKVLYGEDLKEIESKGLVLSHTKSGARVCLIKNEDENKVFSIGFRTPPTDSTGVAHIIEHSVLCGSDKYPLKDPFVELAKGSLNTFLNAMTYPDKTVYPVASCNDQDIKNLMSVYMDAVFHPNIYNEEKIFLQEGHRYELESADDELKINGVVYSEMKGAYSSDEEILDNETKATLYPDITYGIDSGGDPEIIPELTYEQFLDFHRRYYHPVNSYIYLYGNFDFEERLEWLDKEYLSKYDRIELDSSIPLQNSFESPKNFERFYPISSEEDEANKTYLSFNFVAGDLLDVKKSYALSVLSSALFGLPGAPVKQALLDAGIGKDIWGSYNAYIRQPYFTITAKDANKEQMEEFKEIILNTLSDCVKNGLDKNSIKGILSSSKFQAIEQDMGNYPKGLVLGLNLLDAWLYDDDKALIYANQAKYYDELFEELETDYFEKLIQTEILDNNHRVYLTLSPEKGLTERKEAELAKKLADYKASLSAEEIDELIRKTKELKEFQESEDSPEAKATLPSIKVSDVKRELAPLSNIKRDICGTEVVFHDVATNGISYIQFLFDLSGLDNKLWKDATLLKAVLALLNTDKHSYQDLTNEILLHAGSLYFGMEGYQVTKPTLSFKPFFGIFAKCFTNETKSVLDIMAEIINGSDLDDKKRLKEIIGEIVSQKQSSLIGAGHQTAINRCMSYFSESAAIKQATDGIEFYEFIKDLYENFDEKIDNEIIILKKILRESFVRDTAMISITAREEGYNELAAYVPEFLKKLPASRSENSKELFPSINTPFDFGKKNEAFKITGQIQYNALAGNYKKEGYEYTGAFYVMKTLLAYDYLWQEVRVKGGAYGCFFRFEALSGNCGFVSYRDPNLTNTFDVYKNAADFLKNSEYTQEDIDKYIIGALSEVDTPRTPNQKGRYALSCYISGISDEFLQNERYQIIDATPESVKATAFILECAANQGYLCTVGNAKNITDNSEIYGSIKELN